MKINYLKNNYLTFVLLLIFQSFLIAQDDDKKWQVNDPSGIDYSDVSFTVNEGTWMNLDLSPDGKTIVFDMLGDLYSVPATGGTAKALRTGIAWESQPRFSPDGSKILFTSDAGGGDNIWIMNSDTTQARQVTKEGFRLLNNAAWMPDGQYIVARKHFTSTRSLGAGELWMYHVSGGDGLQLTRRKNDQQDVNEPSISSDGRYVYFSEDMYPGGSFQYNKDPNRQIFAIRRFDRETGKTENVTGGSGGACRPQISHDGKWLAFIRRDRTETVLYLHHLATGLEYPVWDGLDKDQQEAWTIFGCYPGYAWTPDDKGIIIWAGGKINRLSLDFDKNSVKPAQVAVIPVTVNVTTRVAETLHFENKVFENEFRSKAIRNAVSSPDGKWLVFNAAGHLYRKTLPDGQPERLTNTSGELEFEPAFSADGKSVAYISWNDETTGSIRIYDVNSNTTRAITNEKGIYRTPSFSPDGKTIVFLKQSGDTELGFAYCNKPGIYTIKTNGSTPEFIMNTGENPRFSPDGQRIYVNTGGNIFGSSEKTFRSFDLAGNDEKTIYRSTYANQWSPSPDGKWMAFAALHKAYICAMPMPGVTIDLSADTKAIPVTQVSRDAGYNLHWSSDSKSLHWTLGEEYFTSDLTDRFSFLPGAPDSLPAIDTSGISIGLNLVTDKPAGTLVFENARLITMKGSEVIEKGSIVVTDNKIVAIGNKGSVKIPAGAKVIDCSGKTIMPGIIDVHAHSGNFRYGISPQKQWEYYANLAYGVTTMHDPSSNSEMVFSHSEMLKAGTMTGPRLYSTGTILYGAEADYKAPVNSYEDALSTLRRTKAWGAFSVKSYNQPRRDQRQQIIAAAKTLQMQVVPEGGSFFYHNLSMVVDGHTGIEHNIPVAPLYNDVLQLWSKTKSHNTPTLIVCYGALNGENYWYQHTNVWEKQRLLHFIPRFVIDNKSRHRTMAPEEEYDNGHILVSKSLKKMQDAGININIGGHGQLQGLGCHWEMWMLAQGGMSNHQVLKCATINGAIYLGMDKEIGSLQPGKLADLIILDKNPLEDIRNTEFIRYVLVNGRLFDPDTMNEIGNYDRKRTQFWFEQPGGYTGAAGAGDACSETNCVCGH